MPGELSEMLEDARRCQWSLAGDGSILTGSWDDLSGWKPARRLRRLGEVGTVLRFLDAMDTELTKARPKIEQDLREGERAEDHVLEQSVERGRENVDKSMMEAQAAIADLERQEAEAEREGKTDLAASYRAQMGIPRLTLRAALEGQSTREAWVEEVRKLSRDLDDLRRAVATAREKGRYARQRTRWINPLVIGGFGLVAGVIATQLLQEQAEDLGAAVPWIVAVVAWVLLDYFLEPKIRLWLANNQLEFMRDEIRLTFEEWRLFREIEERLDRTRLPAWSTMRKHTADLPQAGDI
jgi:hypothetical protein